MMQWIAIGFFCGFVALGCGGQQESSGPVTGTEQAGGEGQAGGQAGGQPGEQANVQAEEPGEQPAGDKPAGGPRCVTTGCSGILCVEEGNEVMTICDFKPEYACYKEARCERQPSGQCGWTETPTLQACIQSNRPAAQ